MLCIVLASFAVFTKWKIWNHRHTHNTASQKKPETTFRDKTLQFVLHKTQDAVFFARFEACTHWRIWNHHHKHCTVNQKKPVSVNCARKPYNSSFPKHNMLYIFETQSTASDCRLREKKLHNLFSPKHSTHLFPMVWGIHTMKHSESSSQSHTVRNSQRL